MQPPTAAASQEAVLNLIPSGEERQMREAMRGICSGYGPDYHKGLYERGEPPAELWEALAEKGYLGVNLPEEWGGAASACRRSPPSARRSRRAATRCS